MNNLTLKQLRYVDALAQHGHFGHAADICSISQPALSMQIKELEQNLGQPLFDRSARHVRLTGFGEEFVSRAREILRSVEELSDLARAKTDVLSGRLRMGVIPTVAPYLLPRVIAAVAQEFPALELSLRETITPTLLDELSRGRLDAAIVALPVSEPTLQEAPLFSEEFVLVRSRAEAHLPVPGAEALREMRLLLLEEGHCFRDQALAFCKIGMSRPKELLDASNLSTLVQMVGSGVGVTLIPEMAVPIETRSADVTVARFAAPRPSRRIGMVWRKTSPLVPQLDLLAAVVRRSATDGGGQRSFGATVPPRSC